MENFKFADRGTRLSAFPDLGHMFTYLLLVDYLSIHNFMHSFSISCQKLQFMMTFGVEPIDLGKISGAIRLHLHT